MKNNDRIPKLYTQLTVELEKRQHHVPQRTLSDGDRQRQGLSLTKARYFITVLENHILERTSSVVFTMEVSPDCYVLRFYSPLTLKDHNRLAASDYTPLLRSKVYLTVGMGKHEAVCYAYAEVKLSQYANVIDLFDALHILGRELEGFLNAMQTN